MSFLERFKTQPKHKSTDPEVRLAAVHELGPDHGRCRPCSWGWRARTPTRASQRAAAARIDDVAVLAAIARRDPDEGSARRRADRLAASPSGDRQDLARPGARRADAIRSRFATVAKTSPLESVRTEAVGRLTDVKALSSVARHADRRPHGRARRRSASRIARSS